MKTLNSDHAKLTLLKRSLQRELQTGRSFFSLTEDEQQLVKTPLHSSLSPESNTPEKQFPLPAAPKECTVPGMDGKGKRRLIKL